MESIKFINIGYGNLVVANKIIAVVSPDSAPIKRIIQEAKEKSTIIDATCGRKTRAVIIMDNGSIVLSSLQTETLGNRLHGIDDIKE